MGKKKVEEPIDPNLPPRTKEQFRLALRRKTRMFYDIQEMRLQAQGRLTKKSPTNQIELHELDLRKLSGRVKDLESAESNALKDLEEHLNEVSFYTNVILKRKASQFKGLGPRMASVIVSSFDIEREDTPSKMWAFAGLAPLTHEKDGEPIRRCKRCNMVVSQKSGSIGPAPLQHPSSTVIKCEHKGKIVPTSETYESGKAMKPVPGEKLRYNAWLRSKLIGVLGPVLLQLGSPYRKVYDDYKHRKQQAGWGVSDAHRHQASIRRMVKMLLLDIWKLWRAHEGLAVRPSYQEEKLGHTHSGPSFDDTGHLIQSDRTPLPETDELPVEAEVELEAQAADEQVPPEA